MTFEEYRVRCRMARRARKADARAARTSSRADAPSSILLCGFLLLAAVAAVAGIFAGEGVETLWMILAIAAFVAFMW